MSSDIAVTGEHKIGRAVAECGPRGHHRLGGLRSTGSACERPAAEVAPEIP
jgi:hypothetical protein